MTQTKTNTSNLYPKQSFIGFNYLFDELNAIAQHSKDNYPPHNIVSIDDSEYAIEVAVSGFLRDELIVEVKDRTLTVKGDHESKDRNYIHKGISTKKFTKTFRLSEHIEVIGADLQDGILAIKLKSNMPEVMLPRRINIGQIEDNTNDKIEKSF